MAYNAMCNPFHVIVPYGATHIHGQCFGLYKVVQIGTTLADEQL